MENINLPWVESPFFKETIKTIDISDALKKLAIEYNENGFIVLNGLIPDTLVNAVKEDVDQKGFNLDYPMKSYRDTVRVQDLWVESESCKELASHPGILEILEMLYGREAIPFQTLNFKKGSQQRAHSDTIHFSSVPARYMCGVWVALEDVTPENGAVFYYPSSQKSPEYNFSHFYPETKDTSYDDYTRYEDFIENIIKHSNYERKPFYAKKGDCLIWSSNIIHGGTRVENEASTRYSQVTHYYFKDCIYYTPMLSNMVTNELYLRKKIVNIKTGQKVKQTFNGNPVRYVKTAKGKYILNNRIKSSFLFKFFSKFR